MRRTTKAVEIKINTFAPLHPRVTAVLQLATLLICVRERMCVYCGAAINLYVYVTAHTGGAKVEHPLLAACEQGYMKLTFGFGRTVWAHFAATGGGHIRLMVAPQSVD